MLETTQFTTPSTKGINMAKKKKFNYEAFANGLNAASVKAVKSDLNENILLNQGDLFQMAVVLRRFGSDVFKRYIPVIRKGFDACKTDFVETNKGLKHRGTTFLPMSERMQWIVIVACEAKGNHKDQFALCRNMIDWYGIERRRATAFKEFIPQDNRQRYTEDSYCGTTREEFTLDNVGLKYEDQQAMESAVENNKWSMDQLIP